MQERWELTAEQSPGFGPIAERFRRAGELDRAVALCREGLAKFPNHLSGRVTLGWALLDLGRYDEARVELERVIKRAPDNLAAIRGLAELHDREEHTTDFVPTDAPMAWPPAAEADNPGSAWRDPDAAVTESLAAAAPAADEDDDSDDDADDLPALMAELEPALQTTEDPKPDLVAPLVAVAEEPELEPLQAVMAELNASNAIPDVEPPLVAELAGNESADLDAALSALTRGTDPAPDPAADEAVIGEELVELSGDLLPEIDDSPMLVPPADMFADAGEPVVAALEDVEIEPAAIATAETLELTLNESADPLLEAAEAVEVMAAVEEPAIVDEAQPLPGPAVDLVVDEPPLRAMAEIVEADVDVPVDPALFELAHAASRDHAAPQVELLRDEVFDLDPDLHVEMSALPIDLAARDFPDPELAVTPVASAAELPHDLQFEAPTLASPADHPSPELLESIMSAGKASESTDSQGEQAFNVSQAFASALDGAAEFASPQFARAEAGEPDVPAMLAPLPPPIAESQWVEPEQPSPEARVVDLPVVPEPPAVAPVPVVVAPPVVTPAPVAPAAPKKKPVGGLQRFLRRAEGRKAKLASESAA